MKNIHLIKTDKPSRLSILNSGKLNFGAEIMSSSNSKPQNIYITSDEKAKEGDWGYIPFQGGNVKLVGKYFADDWKKIILTTDKDLIKDGVQAIDDELLEWFVKNPSCEEVEVEKTDTFKKTNEVYIDEITGGNYYEVVKQYKIIIPKEEPTAYHYLSCCRSIEECHCGKYPKQFKCDCSHTTTCDCSPIDEPKQETLEEVELAILFHNTYEKLAPSFGYETREDTKYFDITTPNGKLMIAVCKEIIKWQQERMYSEEEVRNLFRNYQYDSAQFAAIMEGDTDGKPTPTGWFEKFKKK